MRSVRVRRHGEPAAGELDGNEVVLPDGERIPASDADWLAPVEPPSKIVATHLSYRSRVEEYGMAAPPQAPSYFMKPPSSVSYHGAAVARPRGCRFLNYEGEIAIVIGERTKGVDPERALDGVRGYTVANDFGVHDFRHADRGSMLRVKGQDGFCPLGPALVDAADVDPDDLALRTYVNGEVVQEASTGDDLLFSFAYQVADIARLITLEPGDVILTGTPANSRPVEPGDVVEVEVDGIGRLRNEIVESDRELTGPGEMPAVGAQTLHVALAIGEEEAEERAANTKSAATDTAAGSSPAPR
ncbi:MAG: fumarylacetoacetate hydrolase family protein [Solirubrobacterales bacterium]